MEEIIKKAMQVFEIPPHRTNFLFLLPPFYVAKADGKISFKEISSICYNAARLGLIGPQEADSEDLDAFIEKKVEQFGEKTNLGNLDLLARAINARLESLSPKKAQAIRERIYELCVNVADASGPLFRDHISEEERQMLEKIFDKLEK
ncbi:MAG: TerB family tellurite resistance protein [bacterium]|nr:MAG: TerB family tellurite resistance protein [bacterium]